MDRSYVDMDRRCLLETGGITLACGITTAGMLHVSAGSVDWALVLGVAVGAAFAAAANYRGRVRHSEHVADAAPVVGPDGPPEFEDEAGVRTAAAGETESVDDDWR